MKKSLIIAIVVCFLILLTGGCNKKDDEPEKPPVKESFNVQIVYKDDMDFNMADSLLGYRLGYVKSEGEYVKWAYSLLKDHDFTGFTSYEYASFEEMHKAFSEGEVDFIVLSDIDKQEFNDAVKVLVEDQQEVELKMLEPVDITNEGFVVLLNGIDRSGEDITKNARADIQILLVINPKDHHVTIQVLPRDLYVEIPCANNLKSKLNRSSEQGGVKCNIEAIEQYFNHEVKINYYFRLNFTGFKKFFESLEVPVYVESNYNFTIDTYVYKKGINKITRGMEALDFCRERKSLPENDVSRGYHQMNMIQAIVTTFLENPSIERVYKIFKATEGNVETNFTYREFAQLYRILMEMKDDMIVDKYSMKGSNQYPVKQDPILHERMYYFIPEDGQKEEVLARIKETLNQEVNTIR